MAQDGPGQRHQRRTRMPPVSAPLIVRGDVMTTYLVLPMVMGTMALGWVGGMLTFRRTLRWCSACGQTLACINCLRAAQMSGTS